MLVSSGEGELRSRSLSQTATTPLHPLALYRIGRCDLREALSSKCLVRRGAREGGAGRRMPKDARSISKSVLRRMRERAVRGNAPEDLFTRISLGGQYSHSTVCCEGLAHLISACARVCVLGL